MKLLKNAGKSLLGLPSVPQENWKFNRLTLAFKGNLKQYEKDFLDDYFQKSLNPFRFSIILALFFYGIFAILDAISIPDLKNIFWFIRFAIIYPCLVAVFLYSYSKSFKKYMQVVLSGIMYLTGLGIIVMFIFAARLVNDYSYYAGLLLIFIFGYTFIRARFIYATIAGWSIVITYEISAIWLTENPVEVLVNNNYFFISANVIGMFIGYFLELSARKDFYLRKLLQTEQEKVKAANNELELRVEERTEQLTDANRDLKKEIEIRKQYERERADLEAQLFQLQKMETIGTLAGGIAHDFNNILTPIMGYTEMALEELPLESTLRYDVEQINHAAIRGKDLVQQILTFSREVDFDKNPIQMNLVIKEALNLVRASLPKTIEIKHNLNHNTGTILADATHMHQIIMNLCTNAYHAMTETGGVLSVNLKAVDLSKKLSNQFSHLKKGKYLKLEISDTGHGMDKKTMERIFEPFFTNKEVGKGSGLGLSVVHGIVSNYGGAIAVDSIPGKGSTFTIYLPQFSEETHHKNETNEKLARGSEHILFVDDEKEITYMGKKMLESLGYNVDIRSNSQSALKEFKANPSKYDLLVTDQAMPKMLGTELAAKMKEIRPELKVIVITGYSDTFKDILYTKNGISEIIYKPIILRDFSKVIRRVLDDQKN